MSDPFQPPNLPPQGEQSDMDATPQLPPSGDAGSSSASAAQQQHPCSSQETPSSVKRGRGRPRKNPLPPSGDAGSSSASAAQQQHLELQGSQETLAPVSRRGRGRPRKTDAGAAAEKRKINEEPLQLLPSAGDAGSSSASAAQQQHPEDVDAKKQKINEEEEGYLLIL
jgi:hypothetical protein